jgi:hypothetical protein
MGRQLAGRGLSPLVLSAAQLTAATRLLLLVTPVTGLQPVQLTPAVLAAISILGALGTGAAYVLNYRLIADEGPTATSTVTYLLPVVAVALGIVFLGEPAAAIPLAALNLQVCRLVRNAEAAWLPRRADGSDEHRGRIDHVEQARVDACLDRLGGGQRLAVHALRERQGSKAREVGDHRHAVAAPEPFGAADHEVAMHERRPAGVPRRGLDRVIVDRRDIGLRGVGLRRDHIEVLHLGLRDGGERLSGLGERHPHLDAVDPHELMASALVCLVDAVHGGGLCRRTSRDEHRECDRYDRDGDGTTDRARRGLWLLVVLGTGRHRPTSIRSCKPGGTWSAPPVRWLGGRSALDPDSPVALHGGVDPGGADAAIIL